jgi:hypothetical protein
MRDKRNPRGAPSGPSLGSSGVHLGSGLPLPPGAGDALPQAGTRAAGITCEMFEACMNALEAMVVKKCDDM